ncbi:MAG: ThuA domain-containing protein [Opitutaceae bacterium]|nr:ThuA domain-containing protein [Verrucomicrobiales bacterium]
MKYRLPSILVATVLSLSLLIGCKSWQTASTPKKVLVVSVTTGFRHSSIETAERIIAKIGADSGAFTVDYARVTPPKPASRKPTATKETGDAEKDKAAKEKYDADLAKFQVDDAKFKEAQKSYADEQKKVLAEKMSPEALKNYDAVIFANTTGDLPLPDNQAFIDWVKAGHGFVAIHSGSDTFHGFKPYIEMLGGEFKTHGPQVTVTAINKDPNHPATKPLPAQWEIFDEIYEFKSHEQGNVKELLSMDKHPQNKAPGYNGISWYRNVGQGRVFYTSLGHREDMWDPEWKEANGSRKNPPAIALAYQQHVLGGIKWALGLDK